MQLETARAAYWVREHAQRRSLSLDQLAIYSGLSRSSILQMGKDRVPSLRTLCHIAAYLDIEVRDLLQPMPGEAAETPAAVEGDGDDQ